MYSCLTHPLRSKLSSASPMEPFLVPSASFEPCPCRWYTQNLFMEYLVKSLKIMCYLESRMAWWAGDSSALSYIALSKLSVPVYLKSSKDSKTAHVIRSVRIRIKCLEECLPHLWCSVWCWLLSLLSLSPDPFSALRLCVQWKGDLCPQKVFNLVVETEQVQISKAVYY